jgi:hypothetical protein
MSYLREREGATYFEVVRGTELWIEDQILFAKEDLLQNNVGSNKAGT